MRGGFRTTERAPGGPPGTGRTDRRRPGWWRSDGPSARPPGRTPTARSEDIPRQGRGGEKFLRVDPERATGARIEAGGGRFRLARSPGLTNQTRRSRIDLSEHRGEGGTQGVRSNGAPRGIPPTEAG